MRDTRSIKQTRDDLAERRAAATQQVRPQIDILRAAATLRCHEDAAAALEGLLASGRLAFASLADLLLPQVWATNPSGALLGHLLVVDNAIYAQTLDGDAFDVLSLADALAQSWEDLAAQAVWVAIFAELLDEEGTRHSKFRMQRCGDEGSWKSSLTPRIARHDQRVGNARPHHNEPAARRVFAGCLTCCAISCIMQRKGKAIAP
ncbi:hypothetical protein [Stenotrophomonas maltophilia]|uniref:hypothetical protein n=1 Tax=Stenotrophomonas maltophilia TaxID=40324 RepID=UPI001E3A5391|nr:hypothetical protein [Stenotrophomonas maltophilia]MCD5965004.1 hypothetical protein [Stenotrophomonas maltophilia]